MIYNILIFFWISDQIEDEPEEELAIEAAEADSQEPSDDTDEVDEAVCKIINYNSYYFLYILYIYIMIPSTSMLFIQFTISFSRMKEQRMSCEIKRIN